MTSDKPIAHPDGSGHCPVCTSTAISPFHRLPVSALYRCRDCRFIFYGADNVVADATEHYGSERYSKDAYFDECRSCDSTTAVSKDFRRMIGEIRALAPKAGCILDVGCGTGLFLAFCRAQGWDGVGVEPNPFLVRRAKETLGVNVTQGTLEEFAAGHPGEFDVIAFLDVLEHLTQPATQLNLAVNLLKPNGVIAVAVPNVRTPLNWVAHFLYTLTAHRWADPILQLYPYPEHVNYFSPDTLGRLLKRVGLRLAYTRSYSRSHELQKAPAMVRVPAAIVLTLSAWMGLGNKLLVLARKIP